MVLDAEAAEADLASGAVSCARCPGGVLRPWSWARPRPVRCLDGSTRTVRPRRGRCRSCRRTAVLLPAWCAPRRADAVEVIGAGLVAKARGAGYRRIAATLGRPASTVRRWLRAATRPAHTQWLGRCGIDRTARLIPELLAEVPAQPNPLACALAWLAAAVTADRRRLGRPVDTWTLIGFLTRGCLLPAPAS